MFSFFRPWNIGRLFGIPIRVDPSWILIFLLLTYQLATVIFPYELRIPPWRGIPPEVIVLSVIASLLLFASVIAHELAHALMARMRGISVLSITLFIFGGVAQIGDEPDSPATEFLIAIVGPLISFVIAIMAAAVWIWLQAFDGMGAFFQTPLQRVSLFIAVVAFYLAQANLLLAVFNLLPGFPLDGGRVLRAILWAVLKNQRQATYLGMWSGRLLALVMVAGGVWFLYQGEYGGGWLLLMAWFLWRAAGEAYHSVLAREYLKDVTVRQLMRSPIQRVSEALSLRELGESFSSWLKPPALAVDVEGSAVGLIGIEQMTRIKRTEWQAMRVRQAMSVITTSSTVTPADSGLHALKLLTENEHEDVAVMQDGQVIGSVGRVEIARYLQTKGE